MNQNAKYYAQAGVGLYAGVSAALVFGLRYRLSGVAAIALCAALGLVHAVISGYVWELARRSNPDAPRVPAPVIALVAGLVMFAGTMILWMHK